MQHEEPGGPDGPSHRPPDEEQPKRTRRIPRRVWILAAVAVSLLALIAVPASFAATDQPGFCATCHEMTPFYTAFDAGPHKGIQCVDCHVDPGLVSRVTHKVASLKEVADHFTTKPSFPLADVSVPDARCVACHRSLPVTNGFDHAQHTSALACSRCHSDVGHQVTTEALASAGVLNTKAATFGDSSVRVAENTSASAVLGNVKTDRAANHKAIECTRCHTTYACSSCHSGPHDSRGPCIVCHRADPSPTPWAFVHPDSTACASCHTPPHPDRGACNQCHKPGTSWVFVHPSQKVRSDCATCHPKPTTGTHALRTKCAACHVPGVPFSQASFTHNGRPCLQCHDAPGAVNTHNPTHVCQTCHKPSASWAFLHPGSTDCASCHNPPRNHLTGPCSACHKPSEAFKDATVNHSLVGSACQGCHSRPSNHGPDRTGECSACHHDAGVSWAFGHPSSSACSSCHNPPSGHFGADCAGCHKPTVPFASTTFNHPQVPMDIQNLSCTDCHPNGYSTYTCAKCHSSATGPSGD